MAINDYASLQTAVSNWLHRSDLTGMIPDFISLAEAKLSRALRVRAMENIVTGVVSATVPLPSGFLEMRSLTVTSGGNTYPLQYIAPQDVTAQTGTPVYYSIIGDDLYFVPTGGGETYSMTYYKSIAPLSSGVNWLITQAADLYLYSTLIEAYKYIGNDAQMDRMAQMSLVIVEQLQQSDRKDRYGQSLVVRAA